MQHNILKRGLTIYTIDVHETNKRRILCNLAQTHEEGLLSFEIFFMGLNANYIEMAISFMELPKSFPKIKMPSYLMNLEH
jgi:hypothetical protein